MSNLTGLKTQGKMDETVSEIIVKIEVLDSQKNQIQDRTTEKTIKFIVEDISKNEMDDDVDE